MLSYKEKVCHGGERNNETFLQEGNEGNTVNNKDKYVLGENESFILVVSKDEDWRNNFAKTLSHFGFKVYQARNEVQCVGFCESNTYDNRFAAVVMDGRTTVPTEELIHMLEGLVPLIVLSPLSATALPSPEIGLESCTVSSRVDFSKLAEYISAWEG